jgi:DNA uptake protein ComE-like DNA-binding protein
MKKFIQNYLSFSRKDRFGAIVLVLLAFIIFLVPAFFSKKSTPAAIDSDSTLMQVMKNPEKADAPSPNRHFSPGYIDQGQYISKEGFKEGELFYFDPNTLSLEGWQKLGLNERTISTINNYRNKGGKFHKPEDLKKIWGLPPAFYERVAKFIAIPPASQAQNGITTSYIPVEGFKKEIKLIDINIADSSDFIALPGIGSRLATRIINFREKLGGFYSIDQIGETYGLPDSVFQKLKPSFAVTAVNIKKLNINSATKEELKAHPYIRWNLGNAIIEYRNQHGSYKSLEDLKNLAIMNEEIYEKLFPYLTL